MVKQADRVLVPIQPSVFDIAATGAFRTDLAEEKAIRKRKRFVGVIGMRVDPRTRAATQLITYLREHGLPLIGRLRPNAAFMGLSIFDLPQWQSELEAPLWRPIVDWVKGDQPGARGAPEGLSRHRRWP